MPSERLEKARREIFKRRTPEQCFVAQESEDHGVLSFELHFPGSRTLCWIGVQHWERDRYWLTGSLNMVGRPMARYTRFSCVYPFERLEREFLDWLDLIRKECGQAK